MKISVRYAAQAAMLALGLIAMPATAQEQVANQTLGIEITKPAKWQHLPAEANIENLKRIHEGDPEFQAMIARYASTPVIAFTKFPEPHPDLNPSFKINARPMGQLAGRSATEILDLIVPSLSRVFADLKIEQAPSEAIVGGQPAAYARFSYTLASGESRFPTTSEIWIVPRGSYFLMIGAGTRQDEANGSRAEIRAILSTLKFTP